MGIVMYAILTPSLIAMLPMVPIAPQIPVGPDNTVPTITVVVQDPDGKPVAGAHVRLRTEGNRSSFNASARTTGSGESQIPAAFFGINGTEPETGYVTAWSDAHAHGTQQLDLEALKKGSQTVTVRLAKGRETEVRITMPDCTIAPSDLGLFATEQLKEPQSHSLNRRPVRSSAGSYWFVTSDENDTLRLHTHEDSRFIGWIQQMSTVNGPQSFQLPATGGLRVVFQQRRDQEGFIVIDRVMEHPDSGERIGSTSLQNVFQATGAGEQINFDIANLHPGNYEVSVGSGTRRHFQSARTAYGAKVQAVVTEGTTATLEFREGDHDRSVFDGEANFEIQLVDEAGPASGVAWRFLGPHPGTVLPRHQRVLAREGVTGVDGIVRIENINLQPLGYGQLPFELTLADGTTLGEIMPFQVPPTSSGSKSFSFVVPPRLGDSIPMQ